MLPTRCRGCQLGEGRDQSDAGMVMHVLGVRSLQQKPAHQHDGLDEHLADGSVRLPLLVWRQVLQVHRQPYGQMWESLCAGWPGYTLPLEAPSVLSNSLLGGFRRRPDLDTSSQSLPTPPLLASPPRRLHPSHSRSISSSEKSSGPARGSSKKGRMSTSGPSNHSWCPGWVGKQGRGPVKSGPRLQSLPSLPPTAKSHHHSRCSKQQFRSVPTTPPLRTVESGYWVRGSSRWTTHLKEGTTQCCTCSLPPPPRRRPGFHLLGSSRKARAPGRWLRLESTGPR